MATIKIKAIIPKELFNLPGFNREISNALNDTIQTAKRDFEKTVATWSSKPQFNVNRASASKLEARVFTVNEIYGYVVRGTKPHTITARRAPALRFQSGFTSKTIPRKITSRRGGTFGDWRSPKTVQHPGTKPRDFDKVVAEKLKPVLVKEVRKAIKRATS